MKGKKLAKVLDILEMSDLPIAYSTSRRRILKTGDLPWWGYPTEPSDSRSNVWSNTDTYNCIKELEEYDIKSSGRLVTHALNLIAKKNPVE